MKIRILLFCRYPCAARLVLLFSALTITLFLVPGPAHRTVSAQAKAPQLIVAGLRQRVIVRRDERAIPYIEAATEEDLYFAQGYLTASDRLWQMDLLRRTARGELSEIFGRATLEEDKRHRRYGLAALSETLLANSSPQTRAVYEAYARGVNAYIESLTEQTLPQEMLLLQYQPRPWRAADSIIIGKILSEMLSSTWPTDLMREALSELPEERRARLLSETSPLDLLIVGHDGARQNARALALPARLARRQAIVRADVLEELSSVSQVMRRSLQRVGLYAEYGAASNNWVVSGQHTASGKPLLANDPHLPPSAPSIWHMAHLRAPGINVAGVTIPGVPGIIIGHNERVAWGITNLVSDVQDLYLEKFDPDRTQFYRTPAGWREAEVRHESLKVRKGFTDSTTEVVAFDVTVTRHGPIVLEKGATRYALGWTALRPGSLELEAFYEINRARNWNDFRAALSHYHGPTQNFVYADINGHIGYYGAGLAPIRKTGDGSLPYDGSTDEGSWNGYIPFNQLPHVYDPPSGMIITANNRIVGLDYPYHLTNEWVAPYRARRIYDLLRAKRKLTSDDLRAIQGDLYSIGAATFARQVVRLARQQMPVASAEPWSETIRLFESWDGRIDADSHAAPLVLAMRAAFRQRILEAALGPHLAKQYRWANSDTLIDRLITDCPREWLPAEFKDYLELLRACELEAREALAKRLGTDTSQWSWGRYAQVNFVHPLASTPLVGQQFVIPPLPQNGAGDSTQTINVGAGVSMRFIADASDWDKTQQGLALGESGDPSSPHWKDQLGDWRAITPRAFPFTKSGVISAQKEIILLVPTAKESGSSGFSRCWEQP
ncbi:MAG TPA: penicillin acylase family protein [Pyrinomonadaceae bacterium]|jgi:penicillin amidase|nr:penicillin acylase family protein [Pyrinomonadaceae bacterium]